MMIPDEMAVLGYYVVAGIALHRYKQGWKFLSMWDGYGLSEATWKPRLTFIQPEVTINATCCSYPVEHNKSELLTRAEILSRHKKKNLLMPIYLLLPTELRRVQASGGDGTSCTSSPTIGSLLWATPLYWLRPEMDSPQPTEATLGVIGIPPGRLSGLQPNGR